MMRIYLWPLALVLITDSAYARKPNAGKFNAYDLAQSSTDFRATEVRGTFIINYGGIFIAPDPGYQHMVLEGNRRHPQPNEVDSCGAHVWNQYTGAEPPNPGFPAAFRANFQPVLKLEGYGGFAGWPDTPATPGNGQLFVRLPDGTTRPPQYGDHVAATGLYVTDTGHTWYTGCPSSNYCYHRGIYYACIAHAELHPMKTNQLILIPATPGSIATTNAPPVPGSAVSESHTVVAPLYAQFYPRSGSWFTPNSWGGQGGDLVDDSISRDNTADFVIYPPPLPANGCKYGCTLAVLPDNAGSHGNGSYSFKLNPDNTVSAHMEAHGSDIDHPTVERVVWNLVWVANDPPLPFDAAVVSQSVPPTMMTGQAYDVSVTMKNRGATAWTAAANFKLGAQNPQDNAIWGLSRVTLAPGEAIATGQSKTFSFSIHAPSAAGNYNFQWQMLQEGVRWFGTPTDNRAVSVRTPGACPAGQAQCPCMGSCATPIACNRCNGVCPAGQVQCECTGRCATPALCARCARQ